MCLGWEHLTQVLPSANAKYTRQCCELEVSCGWWGSLSLYDWNFVPFDPHQHIPQPQWQTTSYSLLLWVWLFEIPHVSDMIHYLSSQHAHVCTTCTIVSMYVHFKSWEMMLWKCCTQYASKFGKLSSGHRTGKGQISFQSQRKAMPKNAQTTAQLHSSRMLVK